MRYSSIDILRTFAIFSMVIVHFVENLSGSDFVPSGFGAPLFTFLSGVSYRLWLNSQEARGRSDADISKVTIRRGLFLFGVGFVFNVLWLVTFGLALCLSYLALGIVYCLTIIGIPFGLQCFKLAGISLWPVGRRVVSIELADVARRQAAEATFARRRAG